VIGKQSVIPRATRLGRNVKIGERRRSCRRGTTGG